MKKSIFFILFFTFYFFSRNLYAQPLFTDWVHYSLESPGIKSIVLEDSLIWSLSADGLTKFDRTTNTSCTYNPSNSNIPFYPYTDLVIDKNGDKWISTSTKGVARFDGINWQIFDSTNAPAGVQTTKCLEVDSSGNIYMGTINEVIKYDGLNFFTYPVNVGQASIVNDILIKNNVLWCLKFDALCYYSGNSWIGYTSSNSGFTCSDAEQIVSGLGSKIWIRGFEELWSFQNGQFTNHTSVASEKYSSIDVDTLGNLWTTCSEGNTFDNFIGKFDGNNIVYYDTSFYGKMHEVYYLHFFNGQLCLAGDKVAFSDKNNLFKYYNIKTNPIQSWIQLRTEIDKDNSLWFSSGGYLLHLKNNNQWESFQLNNSIMAGLNIIKVDSSAVKWLGGNTGLAKYDNINPPSMVYNMNNIVDIAVDSLQNLWLATSRKGLYYYNHTDTIPYNSTNSGLTNDTLNCIQLDHNGKLYVGTQNGLYTFNGTTWKHFRTTNSGLSDNYIARIKFDSANSAYIRSGGALTKKTGNNWTTITNVVGTSSVGTTSLTIDRNDNVYFDNFVYDGLNITKVFNGLKSFSDIAIDSNQNIYCLSAMGLDKFTLDKNTSYHYPSIIGRVFYDGLNNGIRDSLDAGMFNQKIISYPDSEIAFSNSYGNYAFGKTPGNYTVEFLPEQDWLRTSDSVTYNVTVNNRDTTGFDFQTYPANPKDSISLFVTNGLYRCNFNVPFWIHYSNNGTTLLNGQIKIAADSLLGFIYSVPPPDSITPDTLVWNFINLYPGQQKQIKLHYSLSSGAVFGDSLSFNAWAEINNLKFSSVNSHYSVFCSYDPNDKTVSPTGITDNHLTHFNVPLDYTVRFQNCGNDTAFNVSIVDTLDANLDLSTFDFEASSHPVYTTLSPQGVLKFRFDDILLPCLSMNALESEGFVRYKISPKNNLPDPTQIENFAGIYFDRNPPIFTNQTWNTLTNNFPTTSVNYIVAPSNEVLTVYPNPATENITIVPSMSEAYQLAIFDSRGRQLLSNHYSGEQSIPVNNFKTGIYFYQVMFEKGNRSTGKIVIE